MHSLLRPHRLTLIAASGAIVLVTACGPSSGPVPFSLPLEAGALVDDGTFGDATMNNIQIMNGEGDFAISLGRRFAAEVPTTITFAFNSDLLDAEARVMLDQQADFIRQFPEVRFRVYGYTDLVGSPAYNRRLGQRRADAVVAYFSTRGISRNRLEAVVSLGETQPVIDTPGPERLNRRAVTEVSGFLSRHPTVMDGKYAQIIAREYVASAMPVSGLTGFQSSGGFPQQ
jgi:peptidoglycan-associated lipoprotein